ncbi:MAG: hypothetical protein Q9178_002067 [Gyalolechia marmorata]
MRGQMPMTPSPGAPVNDVFTESFAICDTPILRPLAGHPEALHEIGLTLEEVDDVLRRRVSMSLTNDCSESPTPCPRRSQKRNHACPGRHKDTSPVAFATQSSRPTEFDTKGSPSSPYWIPHYPGIQTHYLHPFDVKIPSRHQRTHSLPIHMSSPSTSSSAPRTLNKYHSPDSSIDTSASSRNSSLLDFNFSESFEPLHNMASTIKGLEDRIAELESRFRTLENEVDHWKAEAEKATSENADWHMF